MTCRAARSHDSSLTLFANVGQYPAPGGLVVALSIGRGTGLRINLPVAGRSSLQPRVSPRSSSFARGCRRPSRASDLRVSLVEIETIRYYKRIGMLPEPPRTGAATEFMARTISNGSYLSAVAANSALTWKTCVDCYALLTAGTTPAPRSGV